jgi:uncharacterized glyoxalase superfamily protein PhnB
MNIKKAIPLFPQSDVKNAAEFYNKKLGFEISFIYDEGYSGVVRENFELHFWHCEDKKIAENTSCRVEVEDVESLYEEFTASGVIHPNGKLEEKPWGYKEFSILDEAGNLIVFVKELEKTENE